MEYAEKGYHVIRGGWPDFLAIRGKEVIGIEYKTEEKVGIRRLYFCLRINELRVSK